ncbi:MAG TPA: hypothetical protein VMZ66_04255 [Aeromicrobium sp.]|nr:hypothetical protein [Aeromicrobium sp.]
MRVGGLILAALLLTACGPTTQAVITPTPRQSVLMPPPASVAVPTAPVPTVEAGTSNGSTPISLGSPPPGEPAPTLGGTILDGWQAAADFPTVGAFEVTSVTADPAGLVAVGFKAYGDEGFYGRHQGVVWRSPDGRSWTVSEDAAFNFVTLEDVASLGDALYAFGTLETCDLMSTDECLEPPDAGWGIWRSVAGGAWERLPAIASMQSGTVDGVTVANDTLLAYGWSGDESQEARVWLSTDGSTWTETSSLGGMDTISAVVGTPAGVTAFGTRYSDEVGDLVLLGASSSDGVNFSPGSVPELLATTIQSVALGPNGLVAVGDSDDLELGFTGIALQSSDGSSWTQSSDASSVFGGATLLSVHGVSNGYLALGYTPTDDFAIATGSSWFSPDGVTWHATGDLPTTFSQMTTTTVAGPSVVAFTTLDEGFEEEDVTSTVQAWFAPTESVTTP